MTQTDTYTRITSRIVTALEHGVRPWTQPWNGAGAVTRPLRHNGKPYSGINVLVLWCSAMERGYSSPTWMTFKQAFELGGCVRKGETGTHIVHAGAHTVTETDDAGKASEHAYRYLKSYAVFNIAQIDALPAQYTAKAEPQRENQAERIHRAEHFAAATQASIRHGGHKAYFAPQPDHVQMPPFEAFHDAESYYATLLHELTHWTGHTARLNRSFGKRFGDDAYAAEELVAELGAAFLCADLGIALEPREDHASYLAHWLKVLKADKRAIFTAASHAQRAADFLHTLDAASSADTAA